MAIKRVLLVRHGETDYNRQGRWQGMRDTLLNETGRAQAQALAQHLADTPLDAIYSSDLRRAWDTAQAIAAIQGMQAIKEVGLREIALGIFEGLTREEIIQQYPDVGAAYLGDDLAFVVPGGESRTQHQQRMLQTWQRLLQSAQGETIMLVSHGGSIKRLLLTLFPTEAAQLGHVHNTSVTTLERDDATSDWRLVGLAARPHLPD